MRLVTENEPLVIFADGAAGPYITVATDRLPPVLQALQTHGIAVQVDQDAVVVGGRGSLTAINLGPDADIGQVQGILDQLASNRPSSRPVRKAPLTQRELIVKCDERDLAELTRRIEAEPSDGWSRRAEIEDRLKQAWAGATGYCFSKTIEQVRREVAVWLEPHGRGEMRVSNIRSLQAPAALSMEQHNAALADFQKTFIEPQSRGLSVRIFNYKVFIEPTIEEILPYEAMNRLRTFSQTANRELVHARDVQRWLEFVARTHLDDVVLGADLLSDWLEDEGWPEERRAQLASEYNTGRWLLSVYDEERAAR